jgi:fumarate hydratase subunit alpha
MLTRKRIEDAAKSCVIAAGTTFRKDQNIAYRGAIEKEKNRNARWALEKIVENAKIAEEKGYPLCDDTGIPHVFVEVGDEVGLPKGWLTSIHTGVAQGLRLMPGRPMAVRGDAIERVEQSRGLFNDPGKVLPAPMIVKPVKGDKLKISVLLLGGGPEIRARTYRVFHRRSMETVLSEAASWVASEMNNLGCTPCVVAIGIGRTHMEASALMLEAMKEGNLTRQSEWEKKVTALVNATKVGPLGLGGGLTSLGTFIKIGPLRASGVRIVSVRPCCCFEPRRAAVVLRAE